MKDNKFSATRESAITPSGCQCETSPPYRILLAEDDRDLRRLNTELLTHSVYQVDAAENGAIAWDLLQHSTYDLLVTDNDMPRVSGVELLRKLHASRMRLPVIMATGTLPTEEFSRNSWVRPAATLLKPYTLQDLLRTVEEVMLGANRYHNKTPPETWKSHGQGFVCCGS
jgi:DNA-binding NtrC family response regulator